MVVCLGCGVLDLGVESFWFFRGYPGVWTEG